MINGFFELSSVSKDIIFYMFELEFELQIFRLSILILKFIAIPLKKVIINNVQQHTIKYFISLAILL
jgi:hypothetical protein